MTCVVPPAFICVRLCTRHWRASSADTSAVAFRLPVFVDLNDGYNKDTIPGNADDANVAEDDLRSLSVGQVVPTDLTGEVSLSIESGGDRIALWEAVPGPPPEWTQNLSAVVFEQE